ncbi:chromosome partitioning protein ParB [Sulfitobacter geojensis]|uniref:Chromosome partitioning protein ParB n=1 Tax=Sulfitobacter geojensis TaxID=1342299 RepID=A0AAE3B8C7_9RHOB|nr:chromosome partitioning protein ParB [Sulfitobacter geojensis]MBM1691568.1 chromosome partitioning protein ParB [Sulfitobacter geojensis]MBM1695626.1 chromosome partitioning protein ParB [Sulfitobacter geojensis]MBM1707784.1 chromosome partitioning protein ParB [Sulfitobacter geojensis]MBM1711857.1 chromosome partitioning protein ParB [Sulfitobacter geojensis]MBM1715919.1 chromosome partitioning protein ParB [Sulfitobacter geojensis]
MADPNPFSISLSPGKLRSKPKDTSLQTVAKSDEAAEKHGFVERTPKKRRGRKPSPRTGQVHAKVMPNVSREISREASARGVQQGVLIEEAWALYKAHRDGLE